MSNMSKSRFNEMIYCFINVFIIIAYYFRNLKVLQYTVKKNERGSSIDDPIEV